MEIFHNLCRCCNSEKENVLNIHSNKTYNYSEPIINMLQYCLQATVSDEHKYPALICYDCVKQLEISYKFIRRFRLSQAEFEETYKHVQEISDKSLQYKVDENVCSITNKNDINKISSEPDAHALEQIKILDKIDISTEIGLPLKNLKQEKKIHDEKITPSLPTIFVAPKADTLPDIICYVCHKTFFTTKALNLHLKLKHKGKYS